MCPIGYGGERCELNAQNKCLLNPCLHGGVCLSFESYYECDCPKFWSGTHCETFDETFQGGIKKSFQTSQHFVECLQNNCSAKIGNGVCDVSNLY